MTMSANAIAALVVSLKHKRRVLSYKGCANTKCVRKRSMISVKTSNLVEPTSMMLCMTLQSEAMT